MNRVTARLLCALAVWVLVVPAVGAATRQQELDRLVMQLVAEGKLALDDTLTKHLPDYREDTGDRVTIAHLLNHTSGIPSYTARPGFFENESRTPFTVPDS